MHQANIAAIGLLHQSCTYYSELFSCLNMCGLAQSWSALLGFWVLNLQELLFTCLLLHTTLATQRCGGPLDYISWGDINTLDWF